MANFFVAISNVISGLASTKRGVETTQSVKYIAGGLLGSVSKYFAKGVDYVNYYANKLAIRHTKFKIKHPFYAKFTNILSNTVGRVFDFMISSKTWKPLILVMASATFALSTFGASAIVIFGCSVVGILSGMHNDIKRRIKLHRVKDEEKALKKLLTEKQKSIKLCKSGKLSIDAALAKKLGFLSLIEKQNKITNFSKLTNADIAKLAPSILYSSDIKLALKSCSKKSDPVRHKLLGQKLLECKNIARQNNELAYTSVTKAAYKALRSGFVETLASLGIVAHMTNPYSAALGTASAFANYIGSGVYRYTTSNIKQAYKNSIAACRGTRPDVPDYYSVEEIKALANVAKLDRKTIEKLSSNNDFVQLVKAIKEDDSDTNSLLAAQKMIEEAKKRILVKHYITHNDKEIIAWDKHISGDIKKEQDSIKKELKSNPVEMEKLTIDATREKVKEKLNEIIYSRDIENSVKIAILERVDKINKFDKIEDFEELLQVKEFESLKLILGKIETKQEIELLALKMLEKKSQQLARLKTLNKKDSLHPVSKKEKRDNIIQKKIAKSLALDPNIEHLLVKYKTDKPRSYWSRYFQSLKDSLNFRKQDNYPGEDPHELIFNPALQEFAVFDQESQTNRDRKAHYEQQINSVPNAIKPAINLDLTVAQVLPLLSITAVAPANLTGSNNPGSELYNLIFMPANTIVGGSFLSRDNLPVAINHPATSSGINNVTHYLLFARIGQAIGSVISYGVNSYRDWRAGKKHYTPNNYILPQSSGAALENTSLSASQTKGLFERLKKKQELGDSDADTGISKKEIKQKTKKGIILQRP